MVFDPNSAKYKDAPVPSDATKQRELERATAPTPKFYSKSQKPTIVPVNVDGLAAQYEAIGIDPAEAKEVPQP